jgi:general secretion pathway protein G
MAFHHKSNANSRREVGWAGYTLTEMLVVMAILGVITAVVVPQVMGQANAAKARAARTHLQILATALETYRSDTGRYPTQAEGLAALRRRPAGGSGWSGPYLRSDELLADPWNRPWTYGAPARKAGPFELGSLGADGQPGGEGAAADIAVH